MWYLDFSVFFKFLFYFLFFLTFLHISHRVLKPYWLNGNLDETAKTEYTLTKEWQNKQISNDEKRYYTYFGRLRTKFSRNKNGQSAVTCMNTVTKEAAAEADTREYVQCRAGKLRTWAQAPGPKRRDGKITRCIPLSPCLITYLSFENYLRNL